MSKQELFLFMSKHRYAVVSSVASDGAPQSALVGIAVSSNLEVIFDTLTTSRKYRNLVERPACSLVVGWDGEQSVQLEGTAEELSGAELGRCQEVYFAAWPDGPARMSWPDITYFVVRPRWIRYSDFDYKPPVIEEILP